MSFLLGFCVLVIENGNARVEEPKLQKGYSTDLHCTPENYSSPQEQNTIVSYGSLCTPNPNNYCRPNSCPQGTVPHDGH